MSEPHQPTNKVIESVAGGTDSEIGSLGTLPKKPFRELFSGDELRHYGMAAAVYIILGVLLRDVVLNWIVGPLFIVVWMWCIPPLVNKWRRRRK